MVDRYDLGLGGTACEPENESSQALAGVRCWENIPGVPYTHYTVAVRGDQVVLSTLSGECGYSEHTSTVLRNLPANVRLVAADTHLPQRIADAFVAQSAGPR